MGWLISLAVLCGLAFFPIGFRAIYRKDAPGVWLLVGPFRFRVYPKRKEQDEPAPKKKQSTNADQKEGGSYRDFRLVIKTIFEFLGEFRRKIRIRRLELKLVLAGDDPSDLAVNYGRGWAILGNLMPQLERCFVIKQRDLEVQCDFVATETLIFARLDATITLARSLHLLSRHGVEILKRLLKLKKYEKGGA